MYTNGPKETKSLKSSKIIVLSYTSKNNEKYLQHRNKLRQFNYSFTRYFGITLVKYCVTYIGITIDSGLKFNLHIKTLESKIARSIGVISKLKQVLPASELRVLYYSMIYPHLINVLLNDSSAL